MAKVSQAHLRPNPFKTYRDPQTGLWMVIKSSSTTLNISPNLSSSQEFTLKEKSRG